MASYDDLDSLLDKLVDAAIDADMWERGFTWQDGGRYEDPMTFRVVHRGNPGANDMSQTNDTTDYESAVFGVWPGVIDEFFAAWRPGVIPDPADYTAQVQALRDCASPIGLPSRVEPPSVLRKAGPPPVSGGGMGAAVHDLTRSVGRLRGSWVDAFHAEYVRPLPYVLGNQAAVLEVLAACIEAEAEMWKQVRQSVADLAEGAVQWFKLLMHGGNVWELVVEVGKAMYTVFELRRAGNPVEAAKEILGLADSVVEIKSLIDSNAPPDPRETGVPGTLSGVRTAIAQSLEYSINDHITYTEERIRTVLEGVSSAMKRSPETFAMGDAHLARVREAGQLLAPVQVLTEHEVDLTVKSLYRLGDEVTAAAGGIYTSVYPFVRPGSIGIGDRGPYDSVLAVENAISDAMHDTAFTLERAGTSIGIAADLVFGADAGSAEASRKANERLQDAHEEFRDSLRPGGRPLSPYTPPPEEVHVEVPDCLPGDDGLDAFPEEEWHAPMAPPDPDDHL